MKRTTIKTLLVLFTLMLTTGLWAQDESVTWTNYASVSAQGAVNGQIVQLIDTEKAATAVVIQAEVDPAELTGEDKVKLDADGKLVGYLDGTTVYIKTSAKKIQLQSGEKMLFKNCSNVVSITGLDKIVLSQTKGNNRCMFDGCNKLISVDISAWDFSASQSLQNFFSSCNSLTEIIGIEDINISNVTTLTSIFNNCQKLTTLDLSKWDFKKATAYSSMFNNCNALTDIYLNNDFATAVASANYSSAFSKTFNATANNVSGKKVKVHDAPEAFRTDSYITSTFTNITWVNEGPEPEPEPIESDPIDGPVVWTFNTDGSSVQNNSSALGNLLDGSTKFSAKALTCEIGVSVESNSWENIVTKISNVVALDGKDIKQSALLAFIKSSDNSLQIVTRGTSITMPANCTGLFAGFSKMTSITGLQHMDFSLTTNLKNMFSGCNVLSEIEGIKNIDVSNVGSFQNSFNECRALPSLDLSTWDATKASNYGNAFRRLYAASEIILNESFGKPSANSQLFQQTGNTGQALTVYNASKDAIDVYKADTTTPAYTQYLGLATANEDPDDPGVYYGTYYSRDFDYTVPDGTTAYVGEVEVDELVLTPIEDGVIPAGQGVVLVSNTSKIELTHGEDATWTGDNDLSGVVKPTAAGEGTYVLSKKDGEVGFYKMSAGKTLGAHKAYITISAGAKLRMRFGTTTGIKEVGNVQGNGRMYNLAGQAVNENAKGIVIINGKKYVK